MRTITLHLLITTNSTEDNLGELSSFERAIRNSSYDLSRETGAFSIASVRRALDDCDAQMCSVVDQSCNIVFRHLRQLFLEDTFQAGEDDRGMRFAVIVYDAEGNIAVALFQYSWFLWERDHRLVF